MPVYLVSAPECIWLIRSWAVILFKLPSGIGNTLILRGFFLSIPAELQDAASIDGCTSFDSFGASYSPLARPGPGRRGCPDHDRSWK